MILLKKALRSIWRGKRAYAACIALIALGIAALVGFSQACTTLLQSMESYYETQRFGHAFAAVQGISSSAAGRLERLEGITAVDTRTAVSTRVVSDSDQSLTLRLLSHSGGDGLNEMLLLEGHFPGRGEIAVSQGFYEGQGLSLGDTLAVTAGGRQLRLTVSGVAIGPDYVSDVGEGLTGDGAASGYAFVPAAEAGALAGTGNLSNELVFLLEEHTSFEQVKPLLEDALEPYGLKSLYGRDDHPGHYEAWFSIASLSSTAATIAALFLAVAVLVLTILLRRVIEQERTQIGTMKAFGLGDGRILLVYLGYGAAVSLAGCIVGYLAGLGIAGWVTGLYLTIFRMPALPLGLDFSLLFLSLLISLGAGLAGAAMGARSVLGLGPAESMRPPAPPVMKGKRVKARPSILPATVSMAVRGITRGRFRSAFIAGGMALSFAILAFMSSYAGIMQEVTLTQFNYVQLYDMRLSLKEPRGYASAVQAAESIRGVEAQGVLELPITLRHGHLWEDATVIGLPEDGEMHRLYDSLTQSYRELPKEGAVLSLSLAEKLEAEVGDTLTFTTGYTGEEQFSFTVTGLVAESAGGSAYMELGGLCRLLGADPTANSLLLRTSDPANLKEMLADAENTAALTDMAELKQVMQNMLDQTIGVNLGVFLIIGFGVAFAIIASTASISLSERSREYATLRVLGMNPGEIGATMILEYLALAAIGFLPGIPLALGFKQLVLTGFADEKLYISPAIAPTHYLVGAAICLATVLLANLASIRHIARLEMTEVLKERE